MSNTKQILKDALVDAKTVRETALAQAKLALEEAFTPQLQSMLAAKLQEMEIEEEIDTKAVGQSGRDESDEAMEETLDLEALLAEDSVEEAKEEGEAEEETSEEKPEDEPGEEKAGEPEEDKDITEMTPEEVEEYIRTIASEEFAKLEAGQGEALPGEGEEEINLDAELGPNAGEEEINLDEMIDEEEAVNEEEIDENDINIDELLAEFGLSEEEEINEGEVNEADIDVNALMNALAGAGGVMGVGAGLSMIFDKAIAGKLGTAAKAAAEKIAGKNPDRIKMEEALETVEQLRATLQEVNLLNAKLLYMNKVFKGTNLTESQKVDVVKTFDKAESAKEAKLVYESLITSFTKKAETKSAIKESVGFASKAVGMISGNSNAKVIETDAQFDRWNKLAFGK
jgi:hypothetical protein